MVYIPSLSAKQSSHSTELLYVFHARFEKDARRNWDLFYKRNSTHFYKDRHWLEREFPELIGAPTNGSRIVLLEVGCGVGNAVFPLLELRGSDLFVHCCDFSARAVEHVKQHDDYDEGSCHAFQCDLTKDELRNEIPKPPSVDLVTMLFVLSAIAPENFAGVVSNIASVIKPGGTVLFRDYGLSVNPI